MRRRFSQDDMGIRAAESERVDTCDALLRSIRKRFKLSRHAQLEFLKINVRIRCRKMETGWNLAVLKNQHRFEKPRHTRRGFQMAKVCFYGADGQRRVGGSIDAQSFRESMRLNRISHRRASAVRVPCQLPARVFDP